MNFFNVLDPRGINPIDFGSNLFKANRDWKTKKLAENKKKKEEEEERKRIAEQIKKSKISEKLFIPPEKKIKLNLDPASENTSAKLKDGSSPVFSKTKDVAKSSLKDVGQSLIDSRTNRQPGNETYTGNVQNIIDDRKKLNPRDQLYNIKDLFSNVMAGTPEHQKQIKEIEDKYYAITKKYGKEPKIKDNKPVNLKDAPLTEDEKVVVDAWHEVLADRVASQGLMSAGIGGAASTKIITPKFARQILKVKPNATAKEIEKAYRALTLKWHPDKFNHLKSDSGIAMSKERGFKMATDAKETLLKEAEGIAAKMPKLELGQGTGPLANMFKKKVGSTLPSESVVATQSKPITNWQTVQTKNNLNPAQLNFMKNTSEAMKNSSKSFDYIKAEAPLLRIAKTRSDAELDQLVKNMDLGGEGAIKKLWEDLKIPGWEKFEKERIDSLAKTEPEQGKFFQNQKPAVQEPNVKVPELKEIPKDIPEEAYIQPSKVSTDSIFRGEEVVDTSIKNLSEYPLSETLKAKEVAPTFTRMQQGGYKTVSEVAAGIEKYNISREDWIKYIQDPKLAPPEVQGLVNSHKYLTETLWKATENPMLGKTPNYFPHMNPYKLDGPEALKNLYKGVWLSESNAALGTTIPRAKNTKEFDYSKEYVPVMKELIDQTVYQKYGARLNQTEETISFMNRLKSHLKPKKDGTLEKPNTKFDYIAESTKRQNVKTTKPVYANTNYIDTYDQVRRKISDEGHKALSDALREVRDMNDMGKNILDRIEGKSVAEQTRVIDIELQMISKEQRNVLKNIIKLEREELPYGTLYDLIKLEKQLRIQNLVDEVGKYGFHESTKNYFNKEIDRVMKVEKYENSYLEKGVNFLTSTFYKALIYGNVNTGVLQVTEVTRIPVLLNKNYIGAGARQEAADKISGRNVLLEYDLQNIEANLSKQLSETMRGKMDAKRQVVSDKIDKVGNFLVIVGEQAKNKQFVYVIEAEGKDMGLKGRELQDYVRDNLISNAFILHEFNYPKMLADYPIMRAVLQFQQYNMKLLNKGAELWRSGQKGKVAGLGGSQIAAMLLMAAITNKGVESALSLLTNTPAGPIVTNTQQLWRLANSYKDATEEEDEEKQDIVVEKLKRLAIRNTMPFGNQYIKSSEFDELMDNTGDETYSGLVKGLSPENPIRVGQGYAFGKKYQKFESEKTLGKTDSETFRQLPTEQEKRDFYHQIIGDREQKKLDDKAEAEVFDTIYNDLKSSNASEWESKLMKYAEEGTLTEDVYDDVVRKFEDDALGVTEHEVNIRNQPVQKRAVYIMSGLSHTDGSSEAHLEYLTEMWEKGIITDSVVDELAAQGYSIPQ